MSLVAVLRGARRTSSAQNITLSTTSLATSAWRYDCACISTAATRYASQPVAEAEPATQEEAAHLLHVRSSERTPHVPLNFNDARTAFETKSSGKLLRSWVVLSACQFRPLVDNADRLLSLSRRFLGSTITYGLIDRTFFRHFCAGTNQQDIKPVLNVLHANGIGGILDYAAEDDVESDEGPASRNEPHDTVIARTFEYDDESKCNAHKETFLQSIQAAADAPGQGFSAIKVTALGNPRLLERVSNGLLALRNLFRQFDKDLNNVVSREEFAEVYEQLFNDATPERVRSLFHALDPDDTGLVDYLEWSRRVRLQDVPELVKHCRSQGPLYQSSLTPHELKLLDNLMARLDRCAEAASKANVRLMVDAEHSYFQPAIDHAVTELQRRHNTHRPTIFNTYQCYLKDAEQRLVLDMDRAKREGYHFGAKMVRGAYLYLERDRAAAKGYPSPILDTIQQTHDNYNRCIAQVIDRVQGEGAEVMVATHNQHSIEVAVAQMHAFGMEPDKCGVYFGQLLGMADPLTFVLGANGYRAYKYLPYGEIATVVPYLVRRAQENSTILGGVAKEKHMILRELGRRLRQESWPARALGLSKARAS